MVTAPKKQPLTRRGSQATFDVQEAAASDVPLQEKKQKKKNAPPSWTAIRLAAERLAAPCSSTLSRSTGPQQQISPVLHREQRKPKKRGKNNNPQQSNPASHQDNQIETMSLDAEPTPCATLVYWTRDGPDSPDGVGAAAGWTTAYSTADAVEPRRVNECCRPERLTRAGDDCNHWCASPRALRRRRRRGDDGSHDDGCDPAERLRGCLLGNTTEAYRSRCVVVQPPSPPPPGEDEGGGTATTSSSSGVAGGRSSARRTVGIFLVQVLFVSSVLARLP